MQACLPSFFMSLLCSLPCKMGGCQAAALPGIYYEKVYSKKVIGVEVMVYLYCFILWSYYMEGK